MAAGMTGLSRPRSIAVGALLGLSVVACAWRARCPHHDLSATVGRDEPRRQPRRRPDARRDRGRAHQSISCSSRTRRSRTGRPRATGTANAPRAVYQAVLPADPTHGYIVVYELRDTARAAEAAAEQQRYLVTGPAPRPDPARDRPRDPRRRDDGHRLRLAAGRLGRPVGAGRPGRARDHRDAVPGRGLGGLAAVRRPSVASAAGAGAPPSTAAQAWIGPRLILSVCVRGKSSSGHSRQPAIRWFGPSVAFAAFTAASRRARISAGSAAAAPRAAAAVAPPGLALPGEDDRLDPPGLRLDRDRVADAGDPQGVLDVLGIHVEAVGQHDHVAAPAGQDEAARVVEMADVAGAVPAVVGERGRGRLGRVPVAA